jgi:hypothetical protein
MRKAGLEPMVGFFDADAATAVVMKYIGKLVEDGLAEWNVLDDRDLELRFHTGETFHLTEKVIIRIK